MHKLRQWTLGLAVFASAALSIAAFSYVNPGPRNDTDLDVTVGGTAFTTLALDASKTTDALQVGGWRFVNFNLAHVNSTATAVTMYCEGSDSGAAPWFRIQGLALSAGTFTSSDVTWSNAVTGNENWPWRVNTQAYKYVRCVFDSTGGGGSDTLTATARASVD